MSSVEVLDIALRLSVYTNIDTLCHVYYEVRIDTDRICVALALQNLT
jgi:hypothetical protein